MTQELRTFFAEEYNYHEAPNDGDFFCKIRRHQGIHGEVNPYFERLWLARLSASSQNRRDLLDQLLRHAEYLAAFDALLDVPALFCGFRLTVVHLLISMRCEEVTNISYKFCTGRVSLTESSQISRT